MTVERPMRILVVDDNPDDRALVQHMLRAGKGAYECVEAGDAATALQLLTEQRFDCMLLDFWLAGLDAPRFMREMESTWGELPCPCIVLTGAGDEGAAAEAMRAGAFYYLPKGATAAALIHQLHQATAAARLRQELKEQQAVQAAAEASRREAQLAAAELAGVRKAVATLMHELNSPLTGVLHCILMLLDACTEEQRPWLLQMEEACQRMVRVMRRMEELESLRPRRAVDPGGPLDLAPPDQPGLTPAELPGQPPEPRDAAPSP